jgi:predicted transcriptional regulator
MSAGYQSVQSIHAGFQFSCEHPVEFQNWYKNSNYIANLSVANEAELISLYEKLSAKGIIVSLFQEPDVDGQVTAIAIEPGELSSKMTSSLPKALREYENPNLIHKHRKEVMNT